jgi:hypothetical protein
VAVAYTRGMVVDVELPRLDATGGWKERPVVIVSTDDFHRSRPYDLLVALVTHRTWKYHGPTDYLIQDEAAAGLSQSSVVRSSLYLVLRIRLKSLRGTLTARDLQGFEGCLRRAVGL